VGNKDAEVFGLVEGMLELRKEREILATKVGCGRGEGTVTTLVFVLGMGVEVTGGLSRGVEIAGGRVCDNDAYTSCIAARCGE